MKAAQEIQVAWQVWNLLNRLNDLLFEHYEEEFSEIWLQEEEQKNPLPLEDPDKE